MSKASKIKPDSNTKTKQSGTEEVQSFIKNSDPQLQKLMLAVREIVLSAEKGITEHIKWNAPSFCFRGDDRITFNVRRESTLLLIFHRGAKAKDNSSKQQLFEDKTGLLEWLSNDRAVVGFTSLEEVDAKKASLKSVASKWLQMTTV